MCFTDNISFDALDSPGGISQKSITAGAEMLSKAGPGSRRYQEAEVGSDSNASSAGAIDAYLSPPWKKQSFKSDNGHHVNSPAVNPEVFEPKARAQNHHALGLAELRSHTASSSNAALEILPEICPNSLSLGEIQPLGSGLGRNRSAALFPHSLFPQGRGASAASQPPPSPLASSSAF